MKALFLGAGASYECGMPLVWEFTNILRMNVLKRLDTRLFDFRKDPTFRTQFESILSNPSLHYEQMVGELEAIYLARGPYWEIAHSTLLQLVDCVQMLLLEDQMHTTKLFNEKVKDYVGIKILIDQHPCLHVFSLNHDINFEEICTYHGVQYRDGFFNNGGERYSNIAHFNTLTKEQANSGHLNFLGPEEKGVNLIKIHGSLDIFAVEDKNLYLKCTPTKSDGIGAYLQEIVQAEKHSHEVCAQMQSRTVGELNVLDINGELQFLRRSLLSGAHKFQGTFDQIAPLAFFNEFKKRMALVTELDVIGYGFGDSHINSVLSQWLNKTSGLLNIYDPHRKITPPELENNGGRVKITNGGLTTYFSSYGSPKHSLTTGLRKWAMEKAREDLRQRRLAAWKADSGLADA
ncbi:hypothetical protein KTE62_19500 [Burkholderia multivorans]|uniref:hypothetical protein n=1 Tax=Burkholderia multivorans TaxID=87883 RepID=UPI001C250B49|nr:hypothetical protein [Burkholderia multivorans]MBU9443900.1 hypothetical protein [Burkholderia multivorans]